MTFTELSKLPLVVPSRSSDARQMLDRAFERAGLSANIVAEADVLSSMLSILRTGIGYAVLPVGDLGKTISAEGLADPLPLEPPAHLTASIISSGDYPLTHAASLIRDILSAIVNEYVLLNLAVPNGSVSASPMS